MNRVTQEIDDSRTEIDYVSTTLRYVGRASPGALTSQAVWRIIRQTFDSSQRLIRTEFANGNGNYSGIWDNRASLSYS